MKNAVFIGKEFADALAISRFFDVGKAVCAFDRAFRINDGIADSDVVRGLTQAAMTEPSMPSVEENYIAARQMLGQVIARKYLLTGAAIEAVKKFGKQDRYTLQTIHTIVTLQTDYNEVLFDQVFAAAERDMPEAIEVLGVMAEATPVLAPRVLNFVMERIRHERVGKTSLKVVGDIAREYPDLITDTMANDIARNCKGTIGSRIEKLKALESIDRILSKRQDLAEGCLQTIMPNDKDQLGEGDFLALGIVFDSKPDLLNSDLMAELTACGLEYPKSKIHGSRVFASWYTDSRSRTAAQSSVGRCIGKRLDLAHEVLSSIEVVMKDEGFNSTVGRLAAQQLSGEIIRAFLRLPVLSPTDARQEMRDGIIERCFLIAKAGAKDDDDNVRIQSYKNLSQLMDINVNLVPRCLDVVLRALPESSFEIRQAIDNVLEKVVRKRLDLSKIALPDRPIVGCIEQLRRVAEAGPVPGRAG